MKPSPTDGELVSTYRAGDQAALERLIGRHLSAVYNFVIRYTGGRGDDAEDIVQDVFVKAWKNLHRFDIQKNFRTWLFTIAKNTALDWLKKKRAVTFSELSNPTQDIPAFEETIADEEPLPSDILDTTIDHAVLAELLDELHPEHRTVILLRLEQQLTFREIADVVAKPLNTVKSHYRRAVASLRRSLAAHQKMSHNRSITKYEK